MDLADLPEALALDTECLPCPWSVGVWREELRSPHSMYFAIKEEGRIVAQIGLKFILDEAHVMTIAVYPSHRRRGYARALIQAALDAAPQARAVHLEVRPSNTAARALYESLGFDVTAQRPGYYGDEDALLMTLNLRAARRP
ncbi:MAG: ribosomal protein S18-alanine N-acetyltransferase [Rubrobacteraceae bacterium]